MYRKYFYLYNFIIDFSMMISVQYFSHNYLYKETTKENGWEIIS